jgi:hypothetical protein
VAYYCAIVPISSVVFSFQNIAVMLEARKGIIAILWPAVKASETSFEHFYMVLLQEQYWQEDDLLARIVNERASMESFWKGCRTDLRHETMDLEIWKLLVCAYLRYRMNVGYGQDPATFRGQVVTAALSITELESYPSDKVRQIMGRERWDAMCAELEYRISQTRSCPEIFLVVETVVASQRGWRSLLRILLPTEANLFLIRLGSYTMGTRITEAHARYLRNEHVKIQTQQATEFANTFMIPVQAVNEVVGMLEPGCAFAKSLGVTCIASILAVTSKHSFDPMVFQILKYHVARGIPLNAIDITNDVSIGVPLERHSEYVSRVAKRLKIELSQSTWTLTFFGRMVDVLNDEQNRANHQQQYYSKCALFIFFLIALVMASVMVLPDPESQTAATSSKTLESTNLDDYIVDLGDGMAASTEPRVHDVPLEDHKEDLAAIGKITLSKVDMDVLLSLTDDKHNGNPTGLGLGDLGDGMAASTEPHVHDVLFQEDKEHPTAIGEITISKAEIDLLASLTDDMDMEDPNAVGEITISKVALTDDMDMEDPDAVGEITLSKVDMDVLLSLTDDKHNGNPTGLGLGDLVDGMATSTEPHVHDVLFQEDKEHPDAIGEITLSKAEIDWLASLTDDMDMEDPNAVGEITRSKVDMDVLLSLTDDKHNGNPTGLGLGDLGDGMAASTETHVHDVLFQEDKEHPTAIGEITLSKAEIDLLASLTDDMDMEDPDAVGEITISKVDMDVLLSLTDHKQNGNPTGLGLGDLGDGMAASTETHVHDVLFQEDKEHPAAIGEITLSKAEIDWLASLTDDMDMEDPDAVGEITRSKVEMDVLLSLTDDKQNGNPTGLGLGDLGDGMAASTEPRFGSHVTRLGLGDLGDGMAESTDSHIQLKVWGEECEIVCLRDSWDEHNPEGGSKGAVSSDYVKKKSWEKDLLWSLEKLSGTVPEQQDSDTLPEHQDADPAPQTKDTGE